MTSFAAPRLNGRTASTRFSVASALRRVRAGSRRHGSAQQQAFDQARIQREREIDPIVLAMSLARV